METAEGVAVLAAQAAAQAAEAALLKAHVDDRTAASLENLVTAFREHAAADMVWVQRLNAKITENTVVTEQIKEILDGFRVATKIIKFILVWTALIGGAVAAVMGLRR